GTGTGTGTGTDTEHNGQVVLQCKCGMDGEGFTGTNLQENSHHSEPVTLAGSVSKAGIFGVPVHQMQLRSEQRATSSCTAPLTSLNTYFPIARFNYHKKFN